MIQRLRSVDELLPGMGFLYFGPPKGLLRRRGVAGGQVLAREPLRGIVHVRTLFECGDELCVDIGFLPIVESVFRKSLARLGETSTLEEDWWPALTSWRDEHAQGVAGAFACPLWEAEKLAWEAVREQQAKAARGDTYIEFAFPRCGGSGTFDTVVVSYRARRSTAGADEEMLDTIDSVPWESFPQPEWNRPGEVPRALRALSAADSEAGATDAYHGVLYAFGNDHAGTYYPIVLPAMPFLREILEMGSVWARVGALDVLTDLLASFEPEPRFGAVKQPDGHSAQLTTLLRTAAAELRPAVEAIRVSSSAHDRERRLADQLAALLDAT